MTLLPTLPQIDLYIAFNSPNISAAFSEALPSPGASNAFWKNCSQYLQEYSVQGGRQVYGQRPQPATLRATVDGRDGFFVNPAVSGSGFVIQPRIPIAVTSTVSGVTNLEFWGTIQEIDEKVTDELNVDFTIQATDYTDNLSRRYADVPTFWPSYAQTPNTAFWYRFTRPTLYPVTFATNTSSTSVVYTCPRHGFAVGDSVTISGLAATVSGSNPLIFSNVSVTATTTNSFTCTVPTVGPSTYYASGSGTAFSTVLIEEVAGASGVIQGIVSWNNAGAMVYDVDQSIDIGAGVSSIGSGYITTPAVSNFCSIDLWILGGTTAGAFLGSTILTVTNSSGATMSLNVENSSGMLMLDVSGTSYPTSRNSISDGFWHHVGISVDGSGNLWTWLDGVAYSTGLTSTGFSTSGLTIGHNLPCYLDELVIGVPWTSATGATSMTDIPKRYSAGSLLQLGYPLYNKTATDRIAELLVLAGFGNFEPLLGNEPWVANPNYYADVFIVYDTTTTTGPYHPPDAYGPDLAGAGLGALVQPYYWDTPIVGSTILDLIQQQSDTDVGMFYTGRLVNGIPAFYFYTQKWYGSWTWTGTSGTYTPNSSPSIAATLTDNGTHNSYVPGSLSVIRDASNLWTTVQITPQTGYNQTWPQTSTAAEKEWGSSTLIKSSTMHPTNAAALNTAAYLWTLFNSPLPRVRSVKLTNASGFGVNTATISAVQVGDIVTLVRTSPNASTTGTYPSTMGQISQNFVVSTVNKVFNSESAEYSATYSLDPFPVQ